jgi:hypothetical protein
MRPAAMSDRITAIAVPHQRGDQAIELARSHQHVLAAERADDPLADATALALALDEIEVGMASRRLLADKHRLVVRNIDGRIKVKSRDLLKMFHYDIGRNSENQGIQPHQINHLPASTPPLLFKLGLTRICARLDGCRDLGAGTRRRGANAGARRACCRAPAHAARTWCSSNCSGEGSMGLMRRRVGGGGVISFLRR